MRYTFEYNAGNYVLITNHICRKSKSKKRLSQSLTHNSEDTQGFPKHDNLDQIGSDTDADSCKIEEDVCTPFHSCIYCTVGNGH